MFEYGNHSDSSSLPVVEFEARSPVGCFEDGLYSAGQVDKTVAHEEEPGKENTG